MQAQPVPIQFLQNILFYFSLTTLLGFTGLALSAKGFEKFLRSAKDLTELGTATNKQTRHSGLACQIVWSMPASNRNGSEKLRGSPVRIEPELYRLCDVNILLRGSRAARRPNQMHWLAVRARIRVNLRVA